MAHLFRLIGAVALLLLHLGVSAATVQEWQASRGSRIGDWSRTAEAAVLSLASKMPTRGSWSDCEYSLTYRYGGTNAGGEHILVEVAPGCTNSNGYTGGQEETRYTVDMSGRTVEVPDDGGAGSHRQQCYVFAGLERLPGGALVQDYALSGKVADGTSYCIPLAGGGAQGCRVTFSMQMQATNADGSTTSYGTYDISTKPGSSAVNGIPDYTCTAGDGTTSNTTPTEAPCKNGSPGTVNGATVCVPRPSDTGVTTGTTGTETKTNADGTTTTTSTKAETTCTGSTCTTTTTTTATNSGGGTPTTTTTTSTVGKTEYCKANASSAQCNGTGTGTGSGTGSSACEKNPSGAGCGGTAAETGELYKKKTRTVADVLGDAKSTMEGAPITSAMAGFLTVQAGGSCPMWVWQVPYFNVTVVVDAFCSTWAMQAYGWVATAVLLVASFLAFRIAVE